MQKSTHRFCTGKSMSCRVMILLFFFVPLSPMLVLAQAYKSLTDKVQLQLGKTNAAAIVKALQQQTPYTFIYDPEYLQQCTVNEARFPGTPLGEVLSYIDQHTPLDVELSGNHVIALRKGNVVTPATQTNGRIRGKVVDAKNEPLPGVTVAAQSGQGTITAVDGSYELVLNPGVYSLSFSFVSYETRKVTDVAVKEKTIIPLNVVLKNSGSRLKEVTVTGNYRKASIEGLYALQKNNAAITDGISAEQIARTPDKNIGEVLKRVSGLATMDNKYVVVRGLSERYNQAVLNGQIMPSTELNRKNFSFDIIPSNIVENVTVIKTITPDRSAEFGGGLVEVNTLDIPSENFLNLSVGGSYNDKTTGKDFLSLPLSGSEYWGNTAKHRQLFGTLDWKDRFDIVDHYNKQGKNAALFNNNWAVTKFKAPVSPNFQASFGRVLRGSAGQQWGLVAAASYRNTLSTQDIILGREGFAVAEGNSDLDDRLFKGQRYSFVTNLGGMLGIGYRNEKSRIGFQSLYLRTLDQQLTFGTGPNDTFGEHTMGLFDMGMQTSLWQNQLRGEHAIGRNGIRLKWSGSYLKLDRQKPDNHIMLANYIPIEGAEKNEITIDKYGSNFAEGALRSWSRALENNYNWEAAVSVPFKFNAGKVNFDNTFKGGYAGWNKDRLFFVLNTLSKIDNRGSEYFPLGKAFIPENGLQVGMSQFGDNFKRRSASLHALFAMLDNRIGDKWRLVWGVRAEYYNLNKVNNNLDSTFARFKPEPGKEYDYSDLLNRESNWHFFPSVNLTYSLTPSMNLRLAYSESIIRPDLRELSVFREYDFELGGEYTSSLVRSTTIKHLDFRYEWYPGAGEILSASFFYKGLSYPMEIYRRELLNSYELLNSKSAKNYGIELEMRKSFAFTNVPVLRNFTLYGNFTYLDATVKPMSLNIGLMDPANPQKVIVKETIGEEEKRPQMGASNFMFNAGVYYDMNPLSVSLTYNSVTNRVFLPSTVYRLSLMERPLQVLDAQIGFRFLKQHAELKLNIGNLLDSYAVIYRNQFTAEQNQEYTNGGKPGKKEMNYNPGQDIVNFKSKPGRTYSATFTYKF